MKKSYYSITELTLLMALMLLPVTILINSIENVFLKADQIHCQSHLRHIWGATLAYINDHGDRLPHEDKGGLLPPHDAAWTQVLNIVPYEMGYDHSLIGYDLKMNSRLEDFKGTKSKASDVFCYLPGIEVPSKTPYIFDARFDGWYKDKTYGSTSSVDPRHVLESNFLFLDGSTTGVFEFPDPEGGWGGHGNLLWDPAVKLEKQRF